MTHASVHVAVGVVRDGAQRVLLSKRPEHVHQGGLWEFPGGKVEAGESPQRALARELTEEVGIQPLRPRPLIQVRHQYDDKLVLLDVWEVERYRGVFGAREGQPLQWVPPEQLRARGGEYPLPAANASIVKALRLDECMLITGPADTEEDFLRRLEAALDSGIRLVQFRPSAQFDRFSQERLFSASQALCEPCGARLLLNAGADVHREGSGGLHLTARQLMATRRRPGLSGQLVGASCHSAGELAQAEALDLDYALLSPVAPSTSHPGCRALGWEEYQSLTGSVNLPVFALGGMGPGDTHRARRWGGRGIAAISAFWNQCSSN